VFLDQAKKTGPGVWGGKSPINNVYKSLSADRQAPVLRTTPSLSMRTRF